MMDLGLNTSPRSDLGEFMRSLLARGEFVVTGIGSRETPDDIMALMTRIGTACEAAGGRLRSGGAGGADLAFEAGWRDPANCEIYHPWRGFRPKIGDTQVDIERALGRKRPEYGTGAPIILGGEILERAQDMAAAYHPNWDRCSSGARALHSRNMPQVMGAKLDHLSDIVVCWTPGGGATGGTGQAIRVARDRGVRVANLQRTDDRRALVAALDL